MHHYIKFIEFGVDEMRDLCDTIIVTNDDLKRRIGMSEKECVRFRRAIAMADEDKAIEDARKSGSSFNIPADVSTRPIEACGC